MLFKKLLTLALVGVLSVSLVACGTEEQGSASASVNAEEVKADDQGNALLEKAKAANEKIESFVSKNTVEFSFENANGKSEASAVTTITDKMTSPVEKSFITQATGNGQELVSSAVYVKETDGQKELFIGEGDQWVKSDVDDEVLYYTLGHYDMKLITGVFLENVEGLAFDGEEEINGTKVSKTSGFINKDVISDVVRKTGIFVTTGMTTLYDEHLKDAPGMNISLWIDNETGDVVKMEFDATEIYQKISDNVFEFVKGKEGYENAQPLKINKYTCTYEISDINKVESVEFPAELENAADLDQMAAEVEASEAEKAAGENATESKTEE